MEELTEQELEIVKRLFIVNASTYFKDPDKLRVMSDAYTKIVGSDLKTDWTKWNNFNLSIMS